MDRLERLVNLVAALIDASRPLTREELRDRVGGYQGTTETFRRSFERDKDALRQMGIPLVLEPLERGRPDGPEGYRIPRERYELPDPGLTEDELAALRLAVSAVQVGAGSGSETRTRAVMKLAGAGGPIDTAGAGQVNPAPLVGDSLAEVPLDERVSTLFGAVADRASVRFRYRDAERRVDPWRLAYRSGRWYLAGWDHDRQAERLFRVDRLERPEVGEPGAFGPPPRSAAQPPPPWRLGDEEEVVVTLQVDADQGDWAVGVLGLGATEMGDTGSAAGGTGASGSGAGRAVRGLDRASSRAGSLAAAQRRGGSARRQADGSWRFEVPVTNREAFRSFVLGFLDHAEILGPPSVRASFVAWVEALAGAESPA